MARIGELNSRVTLQENTPQPVGGGATTESWSDVATVWGDVSPLEGDEYYRAQQTQSSTDYEVTIRKPLPGGESPTAAMRIRWKGRVLNITSARPTDGDRYYLMTCTSQDER